MECGGDWKHLAPLRYVRMNDGMGGYSGGLDKEVWEGEALFAAIALALRLVEVCLPPCVLLFGFIFVFLSTSVWFAASLLFILFSLTFSLLFS